jgi:predicted nucleic acid-binding protein
VASVIVLDATVLIAYRDNTDPHHADAMALLLAHADDDFAASALTLTEALVQPARTGTLDAAIAELLTGLDLSTVPIRGIDVPELARMRATMGLKLPDTCVLFAAVRLHARSVFTFDDRMITVARQHGYDVPERRPQH